MILSNDATAEATADGCSFWKCLGYCLGPCAASCALLDSPLIPIVDVGSSVGSGAIGDVVTDISAEPQAM